MKVTRCAGEGQGSCKRCTDKGKWNRSWMRFLYEIEGRPGCYCRECVAEIAAEDAKAEQADDGKWVNIAEELEKGGLL